MPREPLEPQGIVVVLFITIFILIAGLGEDELEVLAERVENVLAGSDSENVSALVHLPYSDAIEKTFCSL